MYLLHCLALMLYLTAKTVKSVRSIFKYNFLIYAQRKGMYTRTKTCDVQIHYSLYFTCVSICAHYVIKFLTSLNGRRVEASTTVTMCWASLRDYQTTICQWQKPRWSQTLRWAFEAGKGCNGHPFLGGQLKHPLGYQEATESISHNLFHEKREKENKYLLSLHVLIFHHSFIFSSKGQRCPLILQLYKVIYQSCSESWLWSPRLIDESQDSKLLQPGAIMKVVPGCSLGTWLIIGYSMI